MVGSPRACQSGRLGVRVGLVSLVEGEMGESAVPEHFSREAAGCQLVRATRAAAMRCRAKASNIKDVSTERGRDPVRRKSVVCGG